MINFIFFLVYDFYNKGGILKQKLNDEQIKRKQGTTYCLTNSIHLVYIHICIYILGSPHKKPDKQNCTCVFIGLGGNKE